MKPSPQRLEIEAYPRLYRLQTRYADVDPQNHLNNVAIASFYEDARVRMNGEIMSRFTRTPGTRIMAAHVAISYLQEGFYPGEVAIACAVVNIGRSSYTAGQALFQNGRCIGTADTVLVYGEGAGPAAMPEAMRQALAGFALGTGPQIETALG